ncbi:hypothetical protein [Actinomadura algeriensis]|uniref:EthD domain-containing protein n=1 Tax=Actinomadura algeriensis TaxID=1679523 RepID=A0ABR9K2R4_9ACTN|nr:hypothetical protein [Actinomadura algeriensis]MBE1537112.1 hypothetical protein [Actinomadura algeriensis]
MIKRIRFAARTPDAHRDGFAVAWRESVAASREAPPGVRPSRIAVCTPLPEFTGPDTRHDGIGIEWFTDPAHLRRFEEWLETSGAAGPPDGPVVVADESVPRGADWLAARWESGGERFKHMALARRAGHLTAAEFAERWKAHAGRVRRTGAGAATAIPDGVRGSAYVQNHPRPRTSGEWAYDAVNEVYFDDAAGLRARVQWFRDNLAGGQSGDDGLFRRSWFIAAREEIIWPPRGTARRYRCS